MPGKSKKGGGLTTKKYAFNMGGDYNTSNKAKRAGKLATKADKAEKAGKLKKAARLNKRSDKLYIKENPEPAMLMKDLSGDGKITKKDVLIGAGVLDKEGNKVNKMKPYKMDPSSNHTFRKNVVKKMEAFGDTVYKLDPSSLSLSDPNKLSGLKVNDKGNFDGNLMKIDNITNNPIFSDETTYTPPTRTAEGDAWYASLTPEERTFYDNKYIKENTKPTGNKILDGYNKVISLSNISQPGTPEVKGDAFTSYDKRQRARGIKFEENLISRKDKKGKRLGEVISKLEGKESLNKRQQRRLANLKSRQEKNTRIKNRLENVNKISQKQENQAINPKFYGKDRVTLQEGTEGSSTTPADSNFISFKDFVSGKSTGNTTFVKSMKPVYQMKGYKMKGCSYKNKK